MFEGIRFANVMSDYSISNSTMASLTPEELEKVSAEAAYAVAGASFQITGCISAISEQPMTENAKQQFLYIQSFSYMKMGGGYYTRRRNYDSYLLLLTYSGKGELIYKGESYTLHPGSLFVIDCWEEHEYCTLGESWEHADLHIHGGSIDYLYQEYFSKRSPVFPLSNWKEYQNRLERLLKENQALTLYRNLRVSLEIQKLLLLVLNDQNSGNLIGEVSPSIAALTEYLAQNYFREISLKDMAARCGLSKYHFLRLFKQYTGFTPYDYLNTLRIAQAKNLLADTDLPAYKIGQMVGFPGEASFIRLFKLKTGVTPGAYREKQKME